MEKHWTSVLVLQQSLLSLALLADGSSASSPPDITSPSHQSLHCGSGRVQRGADVEVEHRFAGWLGGSGVVVDHVANFFRAGGSLTLDEPVVSVKGRVGPDIELA